MATTPDVGQDIEDNCSKCGDTWHVVMAKVGQKVVKVVCKMCNVKHNYRGDKNPKTTTTRARKASAKQPPAPPEPPAFDPAQPPLPYSVRESFKAGQRIDHPKFGIGIVASSSGPGKINVFFTDSSSTRVLACAKSTSSLSRPEQVDVPISDRPPRA